MPKSFTLDWTRSWQELKRQRTEPWQEPEFPKDPLEFNEQVLGLPLRPLDNVPHYFMQYQIDIWNERQKDLIINKSNKVGITEAFLRDMIKRGVNGDCAGYEMLLTSSAEGLAEYNMRRLRRLFFNSRSQDLKEMIQGEPLASRLILKNGTEFIVIATSESAGRSWERVKYIFADEAGHTGMLDDSDFFASLSSRRSNTNGYLRLVSTPKGQRGTFYSEYMKALRGETSAKRRDINYTEGLGVFFDSEFIEEEKKRLGPLFAQEYECQFLGSQFAAMPSDLVDSHTGGYSAKEL